MRETADSRDVFPLAELIQLIRYDLWKTFLVFTYINSIISIAGDMIYHTTVKKCFLRTKQDIEGSADKEIALTC